MVAHGTHDRVLGTRASHAVVGHNTHNRVLGTQASRAVVAHGTHDRVLGTVWYTSLCDVRVFNK